MVSSSSQLRSAIEWVGPEIKRRRHVCEVLARGVMRCRRGNAGEGAKTRRCVSENTGCEPTCTAGNVEEDQR
jgi:hypothetical protein